MKILFFIFTFSFGNCISFSVDCSNHTQFKKGSVITQTSYDEKNKVTGSSKATCTAVIANGVAVVSTMKSEAFDKNGKASSSGELKITCSNGKISIDVKSMVAPQMTNFLKGTKVTASGDNLEIPEKPEVGQTLPDAKMKMNFSKNEKNVGSADVTIKSRKIILKEDIKTSAGTFQCFKITQEIESANMKIAGIRTKKGYKSGTKSTMWYNIENGIIKTIAYDEKGVLTGYTLVTEIKK